MSNQPSASFRRATSAPQSLMSPSISRTSAPWTRASSTQARGVSRGMKTWASSPALAA